MKQAFHFKGGNYTISAISINTTEFKQIESLLNSKVSQSESFFHNTPFAIDIREIDIYENVNIDLLQSIFDTFRDKGMIPIGFVTNNKELKSELVKAGHNILKNTKLKTDKSDSSENVTKSKLITSPVRTGQTVEARDCDLIITSNVNNGAELIADGSIVVFGSIGGRVLAGSSGDKTAKIICKDLKADLVSIAGKFVTLNNESIQVSDKYKDGYIIYLKDDKIHIEVF